jgi:hypothetical protein
LFGGQVAVARGVDEGAGRARGVVEQRLVPARGGVVDVDGGGGGLDWGEAVSSPPLGWTALDGIAVGAQLQALRQAQVEATP